MNKRKVDELRHRVQSSLAEALDLTKNRKLQDCILAAYNDAEALCDTYEEEIQGYEALALSEQETFEFLHRQLVGFAEEVTALARKKPEGCCNLFKARQMNQVLSRLKDLMETDMELSLSLVSEEEEHTYSDVSLLLGSFVAASGIFARRKFDLNYDVKGQELPDIHYGWGSRRR